MRQQRKQQRGQPAHTRRFNRGDGVGERDRLRGLVAPPLVFDLALLQSALADHDAMRNADQFHVGEHHARPLVAVVEQHVEAGGREIGVKFFRGLAHGRAFAHADRHDREFERRHRQRPDDAALVVVLLDRRGDDARDADAVTAHFHRLLFAGFVEKRAFQRRGILGAQLEDMADFDAAADVERALAVGAQVAGDDIADVGNHGRLRQIAAPVDTGVMLAVLVCAADEIAGGGRRAVDNHGKASGVFHIERAERSEPGIEHRAHFSFGGGLQWRQQVRQFRRLDLV